MTTSRRYALRNLRHRLRGLRAEIYTALRIGVCSELSLRVIRANGEIEDLGVVSRRVVTTAGVNFLVDAFQNLAEIENFNYHAIGTNNTAEAIGDTALGTEVESRGTGTQSEPAANQYRTVGIVTATAPRAVVEHGIFSQSASGGTLWDRSVFSVVNLDTNDSLQATYTLTVNSGG